MATAEKFSELQSNFCILQSNYDALVHDNNNLKLQLQTAMEKISELEARTQSNCDFEDDISDERIGDVNSAKRRKATTTTSTKLNVNSKSSTRDTNSSESGITDINGSTTSFGNNNNSNTIAQVTAACNSTNSNSNNNARGTKPMPLQLEKLKSSEINNIIASLNLSFAGKYEIVYMKSGSSPRVYPANSEIKQQIADFLKQSSIEFNTFAEKNGKQISFIVRGLNFGDDTTNFSNITAALGQIGIASACITGVSHYFTPYMKRNYDDEQYKLYRFTLKSNTNISNLIQIKSISGFRINIEKMRKSTIIQCHRCQRFQHTAGSCSFEFRCVQCVASHAPGQCPRKSNDGLPIQCCNCTAAGIAKNNHTANNLNACSFFKTKHSHLFNKFQQMNSTYNKSNKNISTNNAVAQPLIEKVRANMGSKSGTTKSKANNKSKTAKPNSSMGANKNIKSNVNLASNSSQKFAVNSGESHTDKFSKNNIDTIACALSEAISASISKILSQFL